MDYSKTINLPKTGFPMRGNLPQKEVEIKRQWDEMGLYFLMRQRGKGKVFILHDGPPYANGDIHLGTALNKILKDMLIKFFNMQGYDTPYVPGWDCHGLPIEYKVVSELGERVKDMSQLEIRAECRQYALKYVNIQREQFKRLGVLGDWQEPYLTLDPKYEETIIQVFGELYKGGYIYRGLKPILWCSSCQTALAEAEVEYTDIKDISIYVKFPLVRGPEPLKGDKGSILIWTTTPWTLPANLAVCLHPDYTYVAFKKGEETYLLAQNLLEEVTGKLGLSGGKVVATFKGKELEGLIYQHPLLEKSCPVILAEHVTLEQGTGCVHTAPGHGQEDYVVGQRYSLEVFSPVDAKGCFTQEVQALTGLSIYEANKVILETLKKAGLLLLEEEIEHSYPHCWRCLRPLIFRSTPQWFISIEANSLRQKALEIIKTVEWIPPWGEDRIRGMVAHRPDWCISRQRAWGVPIPAFYCGNCNSLLVNDDTLATVREKVAQEGADVWFAREAKELLPEGQRCVCGSEEFKKETDILDVWFESGVSHRAVLEKREGLRFPADLYLEGSDQHRGWFQVSLLPAVAVKGTAPFKAVLTHGYVVTAEGKKMAKKLGNVIAPEEIIDKYGADILRLWVAYENFRVDIRISEEIITRVAEAYRRIRNTWRFMLGNLYDFDSEKDKHEYSELEEMDRWVLSRFHQLLERTEKAYQRCEFHQVFHGLHDFCATDLSALYLDMLKDRLYTFGSASPSRRKAQRVLWEILRDMLKVMAPILSFTAEEAWGYVPSWEGKEKSVFLSSWPCIRKDYIDQQLLAKWERLLNLRSTVSLALEKARRDKLIGNSLEAMIEFYCSSEEWKGFLEENHNLLPSVFIVSQVQVHKLDGKSPDDSFAHEEALFLRVREAKGKKCERCWNYNMTVGSNSAHPTLCQRCLQEIGG